jgi:hypothetical protein
LRCGIGINVGVREEEEGEVKELKRQVWILDGSTVQQMPPAGAAGECTPLLPLPTSVSSLITSNPLFA